MFGTHNTNLPQRANVLHNHSCSHSLSNSHSHSRPNEGEYTPISIFTCSCLLIRAKDIQSIITDRQTDNDCIFAGSSSPPCAARRHSASDSCLCGRRRSTLFGRASSLFLWVLQLDSTPLQHCNLTRLAVSHLMAALALHLDSMCRHSKSPARS